MFTLALVLFPPTATKEIQYLNANVFFFQAEDGIRDWSVTGVQTCALPIWRRRGPYATSPPRCPRDLPPSICILGWPKMFQLVVDDEIALVLAEERHAQAMTDLIVRNQARLARWEPWAEQPATLEATRAYIRSALEDFVRGRQISTIIAVEERFVGRC